jgi:hypothetical protein
MRAWNQPGKRHTEGKGAVHRELMLAEPSIIEKHLELQGLPQPLEDGRAFETNFSMTVSHLDVLDEGWPHAPVGMNPRIAEVGQGFQGLKSRHASRIAMRRLAS